MSSEDGAADTASGNTSRDDDRVHQQQQQQSGGARTEAEESQGGAIGGPAAAKCGEDGGDRGRAGMEVYLPGEGSIDPSAPSLDVEGCCNEGAYARKGLIAISSNTEDMEKMPDGKPLPGGFGGQRDGLGGATTLHEVKRHLPSLTVRDGRVMMCRRDWLRFVNCPLVMVRVFARLVR